MNPAVDKSKIILTNIHLFCTARHMSLADLSCQLGEQFPPPHALEYFRGVRPMDVPFLTAVAQRLGTSVERLMEGT